LASLHEISGDTSRISSAVEALRNDGTLATLQAKWLAETGKASLLR
jgi:ABC-type amino acid transport substrate-binding protein